MPDMHERSQEGGRFVAAEMPIVLRLEDAVARRQNRAPEEIYQRLRSDDKDDELCWIVQLYEDDPRGYNIQGMETRALQDVRRHRHIMPINRSYGD